MESDKAIVTFKYFNGTKEVETSSSSAPKFTVKRYQPEVTTTVFEPINVGDMVVLEGAYLNKIDKVLLGDIECTITLQTETELKFVVPSSENYVDGDNTEDFLFRRTRSAHLDGCVCGESAFHLFLGE